MKTNKFEAVAIGCSSGGFHALEKILCSLPKEFNLPILVVQHLQPQSQSLMAGILQEKCVVQIKEADDKESIQPGVTYIAPPNYHLLVEEGPQLALSVDEKVNYARPSIDVLFESAADFYKDSLIGIILTGASNDGAKGLRRVKEQGGLAVVQNPEFAESRTMPEAAIREVEVDHIMPLNMIADFLVSSDRQKRVV